MAALTCELCGGKLIGKPGGIFECDSCGMEYSTEWAKQKIQEIKGTVKVEGTVEVTGTVKLDGPIAVEGGVNIESLLKRGQLALEDGAWDAAAKFFDEALNLNAECSDAYLGKLYAKWKVSDLDALVKLRADDWISVGRTYKCAICGYSESSMSPLASRCPVCGYEWEPKAAQKMEDEPDYQKAVRFLDANAVQKLQEQINAVLARVRMEREEKANARKAAEAERKAEQERMEAERKAEKERLEVERRERNERERAAWLASQAAKLRAEKSDLTAELSNLKGLFSGKRRKEIEARLVAINNELSKL